MSCRTRHLHRSCSRSVETDSDGGVSLSSPQAAVSYGGSRMDTGDTESQAQTDGFEDSTAVALSAPALRPAALTTADPRASPPGGPNSPPTMTA